MIYRDLFKLGRDIGDLNKSFFDDTHGTLQAKDIL
jgi:hypothetical protein